ncbi:amino acid permease [Corynebacterium kroppenstedtii]|uniref:amino acid permease n=1 Tax=Corynebacterium sp. PCR 32 TaxID=3351342 RepID=UPI0030B20776
MTNNASQGDESSDSTSQLGQGLKVRHLTMMGLGSSIGAGLFLGTGVGIKAAGPAVLISYIIAGLLVVLVMRMLGELGAARPNSGTFSAYSRQAFGQWAGFSTGWLYWFMLVMVMGAEITAAGEFIGRWFGIDGWIPALVCVIIFTFVNMADVRGFGEFEYWFSFIKVAVIIFFLIVGVLLIFGLLPGHSMVGLDHVRQSGFAPNGIGGVAAGLLAVAFAFGGIEIVTIAAAESDNPSHAIATAVRSVILRISVFYLGAVLVIIFLLPYKTLGNAKAAADSPFTRVLDQAHVPGVVGFMEVVITLALLSAFNAQIYATSRVIYSMSTEGDGLRFFTATNKEGVPTRAVCLSMALAYLSVAFQIWGPANLIELFFNVVGGSLLVLWLMVTASEIKLRPQLEAEGSLHVTMWGFPYMSYITLAGLLGLTLLMLVDDSSRPQVITVGVFFVSLIALSFILKRQRSSVTTTT